MVGSADSGMQALLDEASAQAVDDVLERLAEASVEYKMITHISF